MTTNAIYVSGLQETTAAGCQRGLTFGFEPLLP